jgi:hypothetical protein
LHWLSSIRNSNEYSRILIKLLIFSGLMQTGLHQHLTEKLHANRPA